MRVLRGHSRALSAARVVTGVRPQLDRAIDEVAALGAPRLAATPTPAPLLAQRSEARPYLLAEEFWLFPGGKVPAFGDGVEMDEILVGALGPTARSLVDLFRENANGGRNGDVVVVEEGALVFHIETSAGHARVRQPGEGDVVEDVVPGQVAVGLPIEKEFHDVPVAGHVVVDHPGGKGDG